MYTLLYINIFIILTVSFLFFLINFKINFNNFFNNNFFFNNFFFYFLKKKTMFFRNFLTKSFFLPKKIIFWKPIFKKTSYLGYFFNSNNKWK